MLQIFDGGFVLGGEAPMKLGKSCNEEADE